MNNPYYQPETIDDRKKWADTLKYAIEIGNKLVGLLDEPDPVKEDIKKIKIALSNYDIYKQKFPCRNCQEYECVCYELARNNGSTISQSSAREQLSGREILENGRGESGDNDRGFKEQIDKLL